ncbi:unnamed protein product [Protopolystoma xenopodis]|uniref:Uncharacterized protein n=1 Tax=Protopolystoma xenopodis TaxID=117903 RepID=A0A3S5CME7_9PLAT|nr:unnamed protein product [Protopolystoma xenopodis]
MKFLDFPFKQRSSPRSFSGQLAGKAPSVEQPLFATIPSASVAIPESGNYFPPMYPICYPDHQILTKQEARHLAKDKKAYKSPAVLGMVSKYPYLMWPKRAHACALPLFLPDGRLVVLPQSNSYLTSEKIINPSATGSQIYGERSQNEDSKDSKRGVVGGRHPGLARMNPLKEPPTSKQVKKAMENRANDLEARRAQEYVNVEGLSKRSFQQEELNLMRRNQNAFMKQGTFSCETFNNHIKVK